MSISIPEGVTVGLFDAGINEYIGYIEPSSVSSNSSIVDAKCDLVVDNFQRIFQQGQKSPDELMQEIVMYRDFIRRFIMTHNVKFHAMATLADMLNEDLDNLSLNNQAELTNLVSSAIIDGKE